MQRRHKGSKEMIFHDIFQGKEMIFSDIFKGKEMIFSDIFKGPNISFFFFYMEPCYGDDVCCIIFIAFQLNNRPTSQTL